MATLIISDLHLSAKRTDLITLFLRFLREKAAQADALYILGDLFEVWLGDDLVPPEYVPVLETLRATTASGVPVYITHGNRDFLLGEEFSRLTGCRLLAETSVIDLYGKRALLLHGDTLCTDDVPYQEMRMRLRHPAFVQSFLMKPAQERIAFARELRAKSRQETTRKEEYIMDANADAVAAAFRVHEVDWIIHGHTHRPNVHSLELDGRKVQRFVLGDWDASGSVLVVDGSGARLERFA